MPIVERKPIMSVGIFNIDEQHKGWLDTVNYLYDSMKA